MVYYYFINLKQNQFINYMKNRDKMKPLLYYLIVPFVAPIMWAMVQIEIKNHSRKG